jgi:hypothetical protein
LVQSFKILTFASSDITNDIALLKMTEPFEFNEFVQPLQISKVPCVATDEPAIFSGWGTLDGQEGNILEAANMSLMPYQGTTP